MLMHCWRCLRARCNNRVGITQGCREGKARSKPHPATRTVFPFTQRFRLAKLLDHRRVIRHAPGKAWPRALNEQGRQGSWSSNSRPLFIQIALCHIGYKKRTQPHFSSPRATRLKRRRHVSRRAIGTIEIIVGAGLHRDAGDTRYDTRCNSNCSCRTTLDRYTGKSKG